MGRLKNVLGRHLFGELIDTSKTFGLFLKVFIKPQLMKYLTVCLNKKFSWF